MVGVRSAISRIYNIKLESFNDSGVYFMEPDSARRSLRPIKVVRRYLVAVDEKAVVYKRSHVRFLLDGRVEIV